MVPEIKSKTYETTHYGNCGRKVSYQVEAPIDVKIGESFSIDITFDVKEEIRAYTFLIFISGAGASWTNYIADDGDVVSAGTIVRNAGVTPTEIGTVWVEIILGFYDSSDHFHFGSSSFGINMPRFKTYNELQSENSEWSYNYTSLEQSYDNYKQTHSYSDSEYNSLNSSSAFIRNLMLIFLTTAIVFVVSTIYFATRKPKVQHT
jgi:hypothetical protein